MSLADLLTDSVTVIHIGPGAEDPYGNATPEETARETLRGRLEQTDSTEIIVGRDTVLSNWRLYLPAGTVISAADRVESAEGALFEVLGQPARPTTPRGEHHVEARLREITG